MGFGIWDLRGLGICGFRIQGFSALGFVLLRV